MVRTITLSLLLLISIGVMLPFTSSTAHGVRQSYESKHHRHRHSRAWWRRYHARLKRRRAAALAHRNAPLTPFFSLPAGLNPSGPTVLPELPLGWRSINPANNPELRFRTETGNAAAPGQVALSVVALSRPNPGYLTSREQQRLLAGVTFSDLRRIVIDKMVTSGGWVINDYEREVTGKRVFVVTAKTPGDGQFAERFWNFYFTEVNGRIYNLTTNTPLQSADRMAVEAERFIASLYSASNSSLPSTIR